MKNVRRKRRFHAQERTERRISAAASISICVLTVIAQIVLTLALNVLSLLGA